jgi:hypothetical protein
MTTMNRARMTLLLLASCTNAAMTPPPVSCCDTDDVPTCAARQFPAKTCGVFVCGTVKYNVCGPDTLPACATLDCPESPSGDPNAWIPCTTEDVTCYCGSPAVACNAHAS